VLELAAKLVWQLEWDGIEGTFLEVVLAVPWMIVVDDEASLVNEAILDSYSLSFLFYFINFARIRELHL